MNTSSLIRQRGGVDRGRGKPKGEREYRRKESPGKEDEEEEEDGHPETIKEKARSLGARKRKARRGGGGGPRCPQKQTLKDDDRKRAGTRRRRSDPRGERANCSYSKVTGARKSSRTVELAFATFGAKERSGRSAHAN